MSDSTTIDAPVHGADSTAVARTPRPGGSAAANL